MGDSINSLVYHAAVRSTRAPTRAQMSCASVRAEVCSFLSCDPIAPLAQLCEAAKVYDISFGAHAGTGAGDLHTRCVRARAHGLGCFAYGCQCVMCSHCAPCPGWLASIAP